MTTHDDRTTAVPPMTDDELRRQDEELGRRPDADLPPDRLLPPDESMQREAPFPPADAFPPDGGLPPADQPMRRDDAVDGRQEAPVRETDLPGTGMHRDDAFPPPATEGPGGAHVAEGDLGRGAGDDLDRGADRGADRGTDADWDRLAGGFVDDPEGTVTEAHRLLQEAVDRMMAKTGVGRGDSSGDTENLRQTFRRLRDLHQSVSGL